MVERMRALVKRHRASWMSVRQGRGVVVRGLEVGQALKCR